VPLDTAHVWTWFTELHAARSSGMAANPISFTEIDAYCRLNQVVMTPWELGLIRQLDSIALAPAGGKGRPAPVHQSTHETPPSGSAAAAEAKQIVRGIAKDRRVVKRRPKQESTS
jgi:hypothetical protein